MAKDTETGYPSMVLEHWFSPEDVISTIDFYIKSDIFWVRILRVWRQAFYQGEDQTECFSKTLY